jgi:hypothetical protein
MAARLGTRFTFNSSALILLGLVCALAAGCKSQQQRDAEANARSRGQVSDNRGNRRFGQFQRRPSQHRPAPNFNGANVIAPPPVAVAPPPAMPAPQLAPPPVPQAEPQQPLAQAGVPQAAGCPKAPASADWKWIVIHHSATPSGNAAVFDKMHKDKGWDELGYHFVVGNGTQSADGQIEVGPRWPKQKWGAHAKTPNNEFNERGIGICLVGNFDVERPTPAQVRSLTRLVTYLMKTYNISPRDVIGHGETKPTDCPGRYMNVAAIRRAVAQALADAKDGKPAAIDLDALSEATIEQAAGTILADTRSMP